MMLISKEKQS